MAWQLIYTSAEHGLSAGRSGFCTVARHAAIRERLVGELERISAYERPSGGQPLPVIYSHRILSLGGDTYHILSCIQDAGPDYSGRTNHIAHHLVCEERELGRAPSPATVLRTFAWRKRWNEPARYFSDSETIDLSQYHFTVPGNAWKELSGNPAHARLLADGPARGGCTLAFAPGHEEHFLRLINESLGRLDVTSDRAETLWQVPFTTYLQSGDNERDFLWRGCWSGSVAHRSAVGSGLLSFDLTRPGTLPAPPPLPVVRATVAKASPTPKAAAVAVSAGGRTPQRGRATVVAVADVAESPRSPWRWFILAGVGLAILAGVLFVADWTARRMRKHSESKVVAQSAPGIILHEATNITATTAEFTYAITNLPTSVETIIIYYGTNDGGRQSTKWGPLPAITNIGYTSLKLVPLTNLQPATVYYYQVAIGTNWAKNSRSFTTAKAVAEVPLPAPTPITVTNQTVSTAKSAPPPARENELDRLPNVPTYFALAESRKVDLDKIMKLHGMPFPESSRISFKSKQFPDFPCVDNCPTNKWSSNEGSELGSKRTLRDLSASHVRFSMETVTTSNKETQQVLEAKLDDFHVAVLSFIGTNSFSVFYLESDKLSASPWLRPVLLSVTNLSKGLDQVYDDYGIETGLRSRLKNFQPAATNQVVVFRFQTTWLTNNPVVFQRPTLYTNTWGKTSDFTQRFSPRATAEALSNQTVHLLNEKTKALENAAPNARFKNILLNSKLAPAGDTLFKSDDWKCTPKPGDSTFSEFLKQSDQTKGDSYNPTWTDYCNYLRSLLVRLKEQCFKEPDDEKGKNRYRNETVPKWTDLLDVLQSATNLQKAVDIVENQMPEKLKNLPSKCDKAWRNQFGSGQVKAALLELEKSGSRTEEAKYNREIAAIKQQFQSLPQHGHSWERMWLEIQYDGTNWWPLIEFMDERGKNDAR